MYFSPRTTLFVVTIYWGGALHDKTKIGNVSKGIFEQCTSTGSGLFAFSSSGFAQILS